MILRDIFIPAENPKNWVTTFIRALNMKKISRIWNGWKYNRRCKIKIESWRRKDNIHWNSLKMTFIMY